MRQIKPRPRYMRSPPGKTIIRFSFFYLPLRFHANRPPMELVKGLILEENHEIQIPRIMDDVTKLLQNAAHGDSSSLDRLYELVYAELRIIAVQKMASERPGHTLQPTALVNEAYLRLGGAKGFKFENRAHFFGAAAEAMRRILVDSARRNRQLKRGGHQERVEWCLQIATFREGYGRAG